MRSILFYDLLWIGDDLWPEYYLCFIRCTQRPSQAAGLNFFHFNFLIIQLSNHLIIQSSNHPTSDFYNYARSPTMPRPLPAGSRLNVLTPNPFLQAVFFNFSIQRSFAYSQVSLSKFKRKSFDESSVICLHASSAA